MTAQWGGILQNAPSLYLTKHRHHENNRRVGEQLTVCCKLNLEMIFSPILSKNSRHRNSIKACARLFFGWGEGVSFFGRPLFACPYTNKDSPKTGEKRNK